MGRTRRTSLGLLAVLLCSALGCHGIVDTRAERIFFQKLPDATFSVYPSVVRAKQVEYDREGGADLARFFEGQRFGNAALVEQNVPIQGSWGHNQARMLRESAADFTAHVQSHAIQTDYAVLAECLMGSRQVIGAHLYVLDAEGRVAWAILSNSHHDHFRSLSPTTPADCHAVIKRILQAEWSQKPEPVAAGGSTSRGSGGAEKSNVASRS